MQQKVVATRASSSADFHRRGIPVISLKGPWLAERLYGDAALRSCCDLDLLVHRSDIAAAEDLLTELGFLPSGRRDDYERPFRRGSIKVELHHDVENPLAFDSRVADRGDWPSSERARGFSGIRRRVVSAAHSAAPENSETQRQDQECGSNARSGGACHGGTGRATHPRGREARPVPPEIERDGHDSKRIQSPSRMSKRKH